jgi:hypothetical protein
VAQAGSTGKSAARKSSRWSAIEVVIFAGLGRMGQKKDVILKNEPKKLFEFNKRLHQ